VGTLPGKSEESSRQVSVETATVVALADRHIPGTF